MIDLLPDTEQEQISDAVAKALSEEINFEEINSPEWDPNSGHEKSLRVLADMGMFGLAIPESSGGIGCSLIDEVLVFCEVGRSLATPLSLASSLSAHLLCAANFNQQLLVEIVDGKRSVDLAYALPDHSCFLVSNNRAEQVLLIRPENLSLLPRAEITEIEQLSCLDPSTPLSKASVADVSVLAESTCGRLRGRYYILMAAMLLGISEATLKMAVEYAGTREQFGQKIGSFQSIKHRCANMAVASEVASAQLRYAALLIDVEDCNFTFEALSAFVICAEAAENNSLSNIHIHGGMGFTTECSAHLYLKRAHVLNNLNGGIRNMYDKILPANGDENLLTST